MKRSLRSVAVLSVTAVTTTGLAVLVAPAAHAATGTLTLAPTSGLVSIAPTLVPSQPCSSQATRYSASLTGGPNNWTEDAGNWRARTQIDGNYSAGASFLGYANDNSLTMAPGDYTITMVCSNSNGNTVYDTFTGTVHITGPTAADTFAVVDNRTAPTFAAVTATPASGAATAGDSVTFATSITSSTAGSGTVQFQVDGANFGSPVTVSGLSGTAQQVSATGTLTGGTKAVTAVFTPDSASSGALRTSTSAALSYVVNGPKANTTITLATSRTSLTTLETFTLTATVANAGTPAGSATGVPTGTVTFRSGTTSLGTAVVGTTGVATLVVPGGQLGAGTFGAITAQLDQPGAGFNASPVSSAVSVTVTAPSTLFTPEPSGQTIQTNVVAGTITVSGGVTAASGNVTLGFPDTTDNGVQKYALKLNPGNTLLTNAGAPATNGHNKLYRLVVTDSRAGNTGYKVTGVVANNFVSGANTIDSATLGWSPAVSGACVSQIPAAPAFGAGTGAAGTGYESVETNPGVDCSQVAAVAGAAVTPGTPGSGAGLKQARELYHTVDGASTGTVSVTAGLQLDAPTTTKAGYYSTTLTLTALGN